MLHTILCHPDEGSRHVNLATFWLLQTRLELQVRSHLADVDHLSGPWSKMHESLKDLKNTLNDMDAFRSALESSVESLSAPTSENAS